MYESSTKRHFWINTSKFVEWNGESTIQLSTVSTSFTSTREGSNLPGWREIIKKGQNATTPFFGQAPSLTDSSAGSFNLAELFRGGPDWQRWENVGMFSTIPTAPSVNATTVSANNTALKYAYRAIQQNRTSFQAGIFLGELRQSIKMIKAPAMALRTGLGSYLSSVGKRTRGVPRRKVPKVLGETWLEYSFGWLPLISDINSAMKAYANHVNKVFTSKVTRQGSEESVTFETVNGYGVFGVVPMIENQRVTRGSTVRYIIGLKTQTYGATPNISVMERAGLTLSQFIPTIWELTPWSFLVDYFTNIGDIIDAGATSTGDIIWVCKTVRSNAVRTFNGYPDTSANTPSRIVSGSPCSWSVSNKVVTRSSLGDIPWPRFEVSVPSGPTKWINLAALATTLRKTSSALR